MKWLLCLLCLIVTANCHPSVSIRESSIEDPTLYKNIVGKWCAFDLKTTKIDPKLVRKYEYLFQFKKDGTYIGFESLTGMMSPVLSPLDSEWGINKNGNIVVQHDSSFLLFFSTSVRTIYTIRPYKPQARTNRKLNLPKTRQIVAFTLDIERPDSASPKRKLNQFVATKLTPGEHCGQLIRSWLSQ